MSDKHNAVEKAAQRIVDAIEDDLFWRGEDGGQLKAAILATIQAAVATTTEPFPADVEVKWELLRTELQAQEAQKREYREARDRQLMKNAGQLYGVTANKR